MSEEERTKKRKARLGYFDGENLSREIDWVWKEVRGITKKRAMMVKEETWIEKHTCGLDILLGPVRTAGWPP